MRLGNHKVSVVSKIFAGVLGAAILLAGSSASAAKYLVSFSGTMASGTDSGLFGAPSDLTGRSFVATYSIDTTLQGVDGVPGVYEHTWTNGASLKIGDVTYVLPSYAHNITNGVASVGSLYFEYSTLIDGNPLDSEDVTNTSYSAWFQPSLDFGGDAIISAAGTGSFRVRVCCAPDFSEVNSFGTFASDTVTITAVPEPATWAMMITGFGLAGAALRRRRALAA
jgi:hypothetical protein